VGTGFSRRSFLVGAGAVALAACSSGSSKTGSNGGSSGTTSALTMITFSDTSALLPGRPQRITFGFADSEGVVLSKPVANDPMVLTVESNGQRIGDSITTTAHRQGIPKAYYPVVFTPPTTGVYSISGTVGNAPVSAQIQIQNDTTVVAAGQKMIPFDTPTVADQRGVELLCTRNPPCPLHDVTLREALAGGTPVAFLVATPQFCQQAICGPVLDVLLSQKDAFPGIKMLHSEVYPTVADAQPNALKVTDVVSAYGLTFEPALYLSSPDGTIVNRLDTIFDQAELHDALTQLAG
jgi:hypothetical protein